MVGELIDTTPEDGELVGARDGGGAAPGAAGGGNALLSRPFVVMMASAFAYFTGVGAMLPILPRYVEDELGGNGFEVGVAVGAFAVSAALLRPWIGRMGDVHGWRILIVGGATLAAASIAATALATNFALLVVFRLLTGAGEAAFFTGLVTVNQDLAPAHRRGEAASYFSVALYGGLGLGPPLGEALLKASDFTTVYLAFGASCLVGAVLGLWIPKGHTTAIAADRTWLHRVAVWPGIVIALGLVPITAFSAFLPLYADEVGFEDVGPVLGLYAGLVLVIRIVAARVPDRLGWRRTSAVALTSVAVAMATIGISGTAASVWIGTVFLAIGMSLLYPALIAAVMSATPDSERSHAVGTFTLFLDLATGLGASLVGLVVAVTNERSGFVVAALCAAGGLVAQSLLRHRIGRPEPAPTPAFEGASEGPSAVRP